MTTPSITAAQVGAFLTWIVGLAVAFNVHMTQLQQTAIIAGAPFFAAALVAGDAIIRHGRSRALAPVAPMDVPSTPMGAAVPADPVAVVPEVTPAVPAPPVA